VSGTAVQTGLVHGAREGCPPASAIGCWLPNWAGGGPFTGTLVELRAPCRTAAACPLALPDVRFSSRESHGAPSFSRRLVGTTISSGVGVRAARRPARKTRPDQSSLGATVCLNRKRFVNLFACHCSTNFVTVLTKTGFVAKKGFAKNVRGFWSKKVLPRLAPRSRAGRVLPVGAQPDWWGSLGRCADPGPPRGPKQPTSLALG